MKMNAEKDVALKSYSEICENKVSVFGGCLTFDNSNRCKLGQVINAC